MKKWIALVLFFALTAHAQTTQEGPIGGNYPVPYEKPTVQSITDAMNRILANLEKKNPATVVDKKAKQVITDFSQPNENASANLGGYPYGVIHAGMLLATEVTGDKRYADFTAARLQLVHDRLDYFKANGEKFGNTANSLRNFTNPTSLDACGAWGAAIIKARRANVGPDLKNVIDIYADYISHKQFRLDDGTLARKTPQPNSLWGDDMYMSIPFLAQMGKLSGDKTYTDDAVKQALQISERLWIPSKGLFAHGWSAGNADYNPEFHWGRVNGWCLMAMVELLDVLPEDHPQRDAILKIVRSHIKSLAALQSGRGFWHQLLDHEDSYEETSCTAMFSFSMARAINRGWVSGVSYGPVALAGWNAVATKITADGGVDGVCPGTNYASDAVYYYNRPAIDDVHGYGAALLDAAEIIRLLNNDHYDIKYQRGGVCLFTEKNAATQP